MVNVYAWPPVGVTGAMWTERAPVQISNSLITGAQNVSAMQRVRRIVALEVPGFGEDTMGGGYVEMLKRYLAGIHLVRLYSFPIMWNLDAERQEVWRISSGIAWEESAADLDWEEGASSSLIWASGGTLTGDTGTSGGFPNITVRGLPANTLVVRPGEFLTVFDDDEDLTGTTYQAVKATYSNGAGVATVRVFEATTSTTNKRINIGTRATGVFRPDSYPEAMRPATGDYAYSWRFTEVFEDEVDEFVELDPWS